MFAARHIDDHDARLVAVCMSGMAGIAMMGRRRADGIHRTRKRTPYRREADGETQERN